ncbi:hypothetical protein JNB62_13210 [Microbacterium jejuense]|uniref:Uncharacterized protein n=1 Tax=Microbacterium jejuense TaxID=1263637 RepID=A0ABS7HQC9_9MICO|nr:hypothetical protein [Microbacterium jejuense]MBW9094649.1 hypothetical protein [Microbacterium jejuense]
MSTDVKKHTTLAPGEVPSRAAIAAAILSINDVIPVANSVEANQVAAAIGVYPVFVARADARGLHRIEYTYNGTVWLPFSGTLQFANDAARDAWTTSNSAYLVAGDQCISNGFDGWWDGTAWIQDYGPTAPSYAAGWSDYVASGWTGVRIQRRSRIVFGTGAAAKATITAGETLMTLPVGSRPSAQTKGVNVHVTTAGLVIAGAAGSVAMDLSFAFPV